MVSGSALTKIRIVLVEPAGALNIGSVARIMKNMGLQQLVLVNPHCEPMADEAQRMAVHAVDILENTIIASTLPEALQGCQRAIATTARTRSLETPLETPRQALPWLLEGASALIFGPEDRGLSNEELYYAQRFIRIPSSSVYPVLNLAQAVAVCCYELFQLVTLDSQAQTTGDQSQLIVSVDPQINLIESEQSLAPIEALEGYYQQLEALLLDIGYLYSHTSRRRMEKFRRLFNRANLSDSEVAMLRGILSQVKWALTTQQESSDHDTLRASSSNSEDNPSDL
ncbi:MAG: RNA methyltransferase [Microcoleaceae cyanobacterium]